MISPLADRIAKAVLYEGYLLYPYRPSALKNRQRFNFGVLAPRDYCSAHSTGEAFSLQTQCLLRGNIFSELEIHVRFLHLASREIGEFLAPSPSFSKDQLPDFRLVPSLETGGKTFQAWQDASECDFTIRVALGQLVSASLQRAFLFSGGEEMAPLGGAESGFVGVLLRRKERIEGELCASAEYLDNGLFKITLEVSNLSPLPNATTLSREDALLSSLLSTHAVLYCAQGEFVSLLDPSIGLQQAAAACQNRGVWPVLVGQEGDLHTLLVSPIILYDYPQVAPESPGDLFDGGEIDEILSLRILTMTDEEKSEMRQSDERARQILERTENLPPEQLLKLHGALRNLPPSKGETP
jgi:hypothetical protein